MNSKIVILLPVHNRKEITRKFLECLVEQTYKNWHLILIDDGCTDGTAEMAVKMINKTTILRGNGKLWWGGSLQYAYKYLKKTTDFQYDDIVLIINDDVMIEKDFLETAVGVFNNNKGRKIISQAIAVDNNKGEKQLPGVFYNNRDLSFTQTDKLDETNCLSTRGLFLTLDGFIKSGGFHPFLLPHYFSDYEFTYRMIKKNGFVPFFDQELVVRFFPEFSGFITSIENATFVSYTRRLFSRKNKSNPIHWIVFALLTAPFPYDIKNICRIIYRNTRELAVVGYRCLKKKLMIWNGKLL